MRIRVTATFRRSARLAGNFRSELPIISMGSVARWVRMTELSSGVCPTMDEI